MNAARQAQRALAQTYVVVTPSASPVGWEARWRVGDTVHVEWLAGPAPYDADAARVAAAARLPDRQVVIPFDGDLIPVARPVLVEVPS